MGRARKVARFVFSVGGYDGISPIRKESAAETAARTQRVLLIEQNRLIAEQNRLLAKAASPARTDGERLCPGCKKPIEIAPPGSQVPFVHTATGHFDC